MGVREHVMRGGADRDHVCQFFDSEESRAECVGAFLVEGYQAGDHLIGIARPKHWSAMMEYLEGHDVSVATGTADGRITVRDAGETLRRLSPNGPPNASAFEEIVGTLVRET